MRIFPDQILPSQDYLKERTLRFIFECIRTGNDAELPPTPLVRKDEAGNLVAIDGHNLIAVRHYRHEPIEVIVAASAEAVLPATSDANNIRNQELADKYKTVLAEQRRVATEGITSFDDLIARYPEIFAESVA
ncbi:MAG TPA: hypothetical protein VLI54_00975 [Bacillota bacterium]|nr:hypothetical protein [Bacillota bacterium]